LRTGRPRKQVDEQKVIEMYIAGSSSKLLAKEFGISITAILGILKKNNIKLRKSGPKLMELPCDINVLKQRYLAGESAMEISKSFEGIQHHMIEKWLKQAGVELRGMTAFGHVDEHYFDVIDTEEKAYWLGFFAADGNLGKKNYQIQITLKYDDRAHLEKFARAIKLTGKILDRERKREEGKISKECQICFKSKIMWESLTAKGILPEKSKNLIPPKVSENLEHHFWRGMIDGDGTIPVMTCQSYRRSLIQLCGTYEVCIEFKNFAERIFGSIGTIFKDGNNYFVGSEGKIADKLINLLYHDARIYLDRKYALAMKKFRGWDDGIRRLKNEFVEEFLLKNHYLKTLPIGTTNYGLIKNGNLVGVAAIGSPSNPGVAGSIFGEDKIKQVMELRRFALVPGLEKNTASEFLSGVIKMIRVDFKDVWGLISFADPEQGHLGIIYQAVGALYLGCANTISVIKPDGIKLPAGRHLADQLKNEDLSKCKISVSGKHKYFLIVGKGEDEKNRIKNLLADKILPYPKLEKKSD